MPIRIASASASVLLLLVFSGCQPSADLPSSASSSLLVLDVSAWDEGVVVQLPIADAARASNHLGALPPVAFAIDASPLPVIAVIQTMVDDLDAAWAWHVELHRHDAQRAHARIDTFVIALSGTLADVSFRPSPRSSPVRVGAPAAAGPVVVVRQHGGRWRAFGGPDAFVESGATQAFETQVRKHLARPAPAAPPQVRHASTSRGRSVAPWRR